MCLYTIFKDQSCGVEKARSPAKWVQEDAVRIFKSANEVEIRRNGGQFGRSIQPRGGFLSSGQGSILNSVSIPRYKTKAYVRMCRRKHAQKRADTAT